MSSIKVIFGGASIGAARPFESNDDVDALLAVLKKYHVKNIDSAQLYGTSEEVLGRINAASQFIIDTKWKGGLGPGSSTKEEIIQNAEKSMQKLKTDKVRTNSSCIF